MKMYFPSQESIRTSKLDEWSSRKFGQVESIKFKPASSSKWSWERTETDYEKAVMIVQKQSTLGLM